MLCFLASFGGGEDNSAYGERTLSTSSARGCSRFYVTMDLVKHTAPMWVSFFLASIYGKLTGTYKKHGKRDGRWRDVVIVERLIPSNLA